MSEIRYFTDGEQATAATLNRPIQDLALLNEAPTWAQVKRERENNRIMYPVSGQINGKGSELELVESGSKASNTLFRTNIYTNTTEGINNNCLMQTLDESDVCCYTRYGDKAFNIAGQFFKSAFRNKMQTSQKNIYYGGGSYQGSIHFPKPSIDATKPLSRMDLVAIEMWDEKISDKGVVFWKGLVQTSIGNDTLESAGVEPSYTSFYLNEELEEDNSNQAVRCYIWDKLTDSQKRDFIQDNEFGIFVKDDEFYQTRYRWRIIKGFKNRDTYTVTFEEPTEDTGKLYNLHDYTTSGSSVEGVYPITVQGKNNRPTTITYQGRDATYTGAKIKNDQGVYISKNGSGDDVFFMPIFAVQRRNYGAYHPFLNPYGTSAYSNKQTWIEANPGSTVECFDRIAYVSTFENNFVITGNERSFLENAVSFTHDLDGYSTYGLIPMLYDSSYPSYDTHSIFLTAEKDDYNLTWELSEEKTLKRAIIQVSNDWMTSKRTWFPREFKIFGSNTGEFNGEETELIYITSGDSPDIDSNNVMTYKKHPYSMVLDIDNSNSFKYYRFSHLDVNFQSGMDKIEFFEDTSAVSNFVLNGIRGLSLVNGSSEYLPNMPKHKYFTTRYRHLKNSFYSDSNGIPLDTDFNIFIDGNDTGKKIKFTAYVKEKIPSGSEYNYDRFCIDGVSIHKADYIMQSDVVDLRYILSSKSGLKQ